MQDLLDFYQFGGFFNHVVTLFGLAALVALVKYSAAPQGDDPDPPLLRLCARLIGLAVAAGLLGTVFNTFELSAALAVISAEHASDALYRGLGLVPIPLAWALLCALPILTATTWLRHRAATA